MDSQQEPVRYKSNVLFGLESDSVVSFFAARVVGKKYISDNKKMVAVRVKTMLMASK